jgi:hypothetical protein
MLGIIWVIACIYFGYNNADWWVFGLLALSAIIIYFIMKPTELFNSLQDGNKGYIYVFVVLPICQALATGIFYGIGYLMAKMF